VIEDASKQDVEKQKSRIARMQRSLRAANAHLKYLGEKQSPTDPRAHLSVNPGSTKRLQWAIKDRAMFGVLIGLVEAHVDGLQELLSESQLRTSQQEVTRFAIQVVGSSSDTQSLSALTTTDTAVNKRFEELPARNLLFPQDELAEFEDLPRWYNEASPPQQQSEIDMRFLAQLRSFHASLGVR
jgi:hypothetical protein